MEVKTSIGRFFKPPGTGSDTSEPSEEGRRIKQNKPEYPWALTRRFAMISPLGSDKQICNKFCIAFIKKMNLKSPCIFCFDSVKQISLESLGF